MTFAVGDVVTVKPESPLQSYDDKTYEVVAVFDRINNYDTLIRHTGRVGAIPFIANSNNFQKAGEKFEVGKTYVLTAYRNVGPTVRVVHVEGEFAFGVLSTTPATAWYSTHSNRDAWVEVETDKAL